jgi:hypothetical protein
MMYFYDFQVSPKVSERLPEECKLLVGETTCGGFETLGGDKTQSFISTNK